MKTNSTDLLNLTVTDSPRRSWLLRFWIVGCLLATSFCVFKGLEASSSTGPTTRQTTVTKEVRRQTRMDEVKVGDVVLARDEFGDTVAPKKVREIFRRTSDHLRHLTFEARDGTRQTIKTTDEHPFALADSLDFVPAGELTIGTEVPGPKGERQTLVASTREDHPEGIPVFNFEVEGFHTYFVSTNASAVLVHNTCQTTILGENMRDRVIPFAEATGNRVLPFGTTAERWRQLSARERWRLNDGALRARIRAGDRFEYIGIDPDRRSLLRERFDLTRSELHRLSERGIQYDSISNEIVESILRNH